MNPVNKILLGVGAGIVLVVAFVTMWLTLANAHLKVQLAEARADMGTCESANDDFRQKTEMQNRIIGEWKNQDQARQKQMEILKHAAQKKSANLDQNATKLSYAKPSGDDCKAVEALMNQFLADHL